MLVELRKPKLHRGPVLVGSRIGPPFEQAAQRLEAVVVAIERLERIHRVRVVLVNLEGDFVSANCGPRIVELVTVYLARGLSDLRAFGARNDFHLAFQ